MLSVSTNPNPARSGRHHTAAMGDAATKKQRKDAEKVRRDRFSSEVRNIANLLPPRLAGPSGAPAKKPTKAATLRCAASYLRLQLFFPRQAGGGGRTRGKRNWISATVEDEIFNDFLDSLGGFILLTNLTGKILLVSETVTRCLGHQTIDMMGNSIFDFIYESDQTRVAGEFQRVMQSFDLFNVKDGEMSSPRFSFFCRFKEKLQPKVDNVSYQVVRVSGAISGPVPADGVFERSHMNLREFKFVAHAQKYDFSPLKKLSLLDSRENEYITKHRLDGTIIFADQRISNLTGHLPIEVINRSAHMYINTNDVNFAKNALQDTTLPTTLPATLPNEDVFVFEVLVSGSGYVVYRLKTKSSTLIYMRSAGGVLYDKTTSQPEYFVCVNTLLEEDEGEKERLEFASRYEHSGGDNQITQSEIRDALSVANLRGEESEAHQMPALECGSLNPAASENVAYSNLSVAKGCLLKMRSKRPRFDDQVSGFSTSLTDLPRDSECHSVCSSSGGQSHTNYDMSPLRSSPDFVSPSTTTTPITSPTSNEIDSPGLIQGNNLQSTSQYSTSSGEVNYHQRNQWTTNQTDGHGLLLLVYQSSTSPSSEGHAPQQASTPPNSIPTDSGNVANQLHHQQHHLGHHHQHHNYDNHHHHHHNHNHHHHHQHQHQHFHGHPRQM